MILAANRSVFGLLAASCAVVVLGCADLSSPDASVPSDLGVERDFSLRRDLAAAADLATPAACTHYATWPSVNPLGSYDATNMVTFVYSLDGAMVPANALAIEDFQSMGEMYPKMVTYSTKDTYSQCEVCTKVAVCDSNGCADTFFAQGGSVAVTRADRSAAGEMVATATNLTLVEWDFSMNGDKPVPGGRCITIDSASFDVKWSPEDGGGATDGGVADLSVASTDMSAAPGDMKATSRDMATGAVDLKSTDLAKTTVDLARSPVDLAGVCHPVINEVQTGGVTAGDEWVEIYNPCAGLDLTGWKLGYRSAGNNSGRPSIVLYTFAANIVGPYILLAGPSYAGSVMPDDGWLSGGLASTGGAVGLIDPNGNRIDSVAYKTLTTTNDFTEGSGPAANPPASQSIARLPNGTDTDDNAKDFQVVTKPTLKAAN